MAASNQMTGKTGIPEGWRLVRLGEVATVNPRRPKLVIDSQTPVTFIPMAAVGENCSGILARKNRQYREVSKGYTYFQEYDVLFSKITPCLQNGKHTLATRLSKGFGFGTTEFHVLRAKGNIEPRHLYRVVTQTANIDKCTRSFTGTAGQQRVQPETIKSLPILLPPLPEQRAIAASVDSIDEAIESTEAVVAATERLRDALLHRLLTRGVPGWHSEWKEVRGLGTIPASWNVVRLEDVTEVKGGKRLPKGSSFAAENTGLPYIRVVDFHNGTIRESEVRFLSPEIQKAIGRYTISSNDVYISIAGTIGIVGIVPKALDGANLTENAAKIVIRNAGLLSQYFLMAFLDSHRGQSQISQRVHALGQPKLALERIRTIQLPLPQFQEQQAIAEVLASVDEAIERRRTETEMLQSLKASAADTLLAGRVRVGQFR